MMGYRDMQRRILLVAFVILFSLVTTSCLDSGGQLLPTPDSSFYTVDPVFREFYNVLGGQAVLGEAISPVWKKDSITYQYTMAGLMSFDPHRPAAQRFELAPLGLELGFGAPGAGGTEIDDRFQPLYDQLKGIVFVGKPLTNVIYNEEKSRSEQYFENLGFYQDPEKDDGIYLLPYGAWKCGEACRSSLPVSATPLESTPTHPVFNLPGRAENTPAPVEGHHWVIQAWESMPMVAPTEEQEIKVSILRDGTPLEGAQADLIIELPDGSSQHASFPPTNADGSTRLKVQPVQTANGTVIPYEVCLNCENSEIYCIRQSYMVWSKP